jgi:FixJ family two-component response regulator
MEAVPKVFVVDDDPKVRAGLKRLLEFSGFAAATFASAREFLGQLEPEACGCVILDLAMPGIDGLGVQQALAERGSAMPVIFLTGQGDIPTSVKAMKRGAADFLAKSELLAAVQHAMQRCEALHRARQEVADIERRHATLTPREREVLAHVLAGRLNKQIAADLGTVEYTIKLHRSRVMQKMRAPTLATLIRLAERAGIKPATLSGP